MSMLNFINDISYHRRVPRNDLVHHLLGNGHLQAVVQVTENPLARNALVLHLMHPERFRPKASSFTFHQQVGPELTSVMLWHEGHLYIPNPAQTAQDLHYNLSFQDGYPVFKATYPADFTLTGERLKSPFNISEEIFCPPGHPGLLRRLTITNQRGLSPASASLFAFMVPNQTIFPEAHYLTKEQIATAGYFEKGDEFLGLASFVQASRHQVGLFPDPIDQAFSGYLAESGISSDDDQFVRPVGDYTNYPLLPGSPHVGAVLALQFDLGDIAMGASSQIDLIYAYGNSEQEVIETVNLIRGKSFDSWGAAARETIQEVNSLQTGDHRLDNFYAAVRSGIRASVGLSGRMDACIWGFNSEWVRDSSLACVGVIHSGQFEMARAMLNHILDELVDPDGLAFGEGRFYALHHAEPDQNGELLYALWMYWVHARDDHFIKNYWPQIHAVAEFPIGPDFWDEQASMIKSERDIRERDRERHGMLPGFELAYQMWVSLGLNKAADMADHAGAKDAAIRWRNFADRMWQAALHHPTFQLVENGYLMKRRLLDGTFQRYAVSKPYVHRVYDNLTKMYPRCLNREGALEPDHSESYPIALGMIAPDSELAQRTLIRMEQLWNQEWNFGGYPLHNADSEPTKLGGHLLPIQLITQAALESRQFDTVRRNINWLLDMKDGWGYTWWEYRDADPQLQIDHGIPPWFGFSEPLVMFVYHLLGYRPQPDSILIRPHLLPELKYITARLRSGKHWIQLHFHNDGRWITRVEVDSQAWDQFNRDELRIPIPEQDTDVKIWLTDE